MLTTRVRRISYCALCFFLGTFAVGALAGPQEDYDDGMRLYRDGDIVESMAPLRKAADQGHAAAQAMFGYLLDIADFDEDAVGYYRKSAEQGNAEGQFGYGNALLGGEGVAKNALEGEKWVRRAAEAGHEMAINQVALMYLNRNDPSTQEEAMKWINMSLERNFIPVIQGLAQAYLEGRLGLPVNEKRAAELTSKANKLMGLEKRKRRGAGK